jgi:hypothetical protein
MTKGMGSKRLGLLCDLLPRARRVAVLVDPNDDAAVIKSMIADVRGAARSIGREIDVFYAGNVGYNQGTAPIVRSRSPTFIGQELGITPVG